MNYLPIGSVVLLNNGVKPVMIYGYMQKMENDERIFDYVSCLYPEGYISLDYTYLFNHDDIKEVIFSGYTTSDYEIVVAKLNSFKEKSAEQ